MSKKHLFENFNAAAYENTTDPFASILEGPKFTFGNTNKDIVNGESEEGDEVGRVNDGNVKASFHTMTPEELESAQEKARGEENRLEASELMAEEEPSDLEKQADDILFYNYPEDTMRDAVKNSADAMSYVDDIGDFDVAVDFEGPDYSISGRQLVPHSEEPLEMDSEEQFGLDNPEGVLGEVEPEVVDEPAETPAKDIIALHDISDEELMKELQFRMANKLKA